MNDHNPSSADGPTPQVDATEIESRAAGPAGDLSTQEELGLPNSSDKEPIVEVDLDSQPNLESESEFQARLDAGDAEVLPASRKQTRRSFVAAAAGAAAG